MIAIKIIKFYQRFISPCLSRHCRFHPTCSQYAVLSIKKYGLVRGCWKGFKRIIRCHPWNQGGIDYP